MRQVKNGQFALRYRIAFFGGDYPHARGILDGMAGSSVEVGSLWWMAASKFVRHDLVRDLDHAVTDFVFQTQRSEAKLHKCRSAIGLVQNLPGNKRRNKLQIAEDSLGFDLLYQTTQGIHNLILRRCRIVRWPGAKSHRFINMGSGSLKGILLRVHASPRS